MSPLRKEFIGRLRLRGLKDNTIENYISAVAAASKYYNRSPLSLTSGEVRAYLLYLIEEKQLAPATVNLHMDALKTFYNLMSPGSTIMEGISHLKVPKQLPVVLSREELDRMLNACTNSKHKAIIALLYSSGLRLAECAQLLICHIDSDRMKVRVENGKGARDRYTILSVRALGLLRQYVHQYRPRKWLFEGRNGQPLGLRAIGKAVTKAADLAGIRKRVHPHMLRHTFATHLHESGTSVPVIQKLLGHSSIKTTMVYLHLSSVCLDSVVNPLDVDIPSPRQRRPLMEGTDA